MPSQKIEKTSNLVLKKFSMMEAQIPQTNSNAQLVAATNDSRSTSSERLNASRTLRDVKVYEWIAVIILCFVNLINYMDRFTIAGILGDIQTFFDIQDDKAGLLQTGFVLSYMIFAPIFGYMGDRYNRSVIMSGGVLLWSITTLLGSYMDNYWGFLFFRALVGIGEASYSTIAPTIISDLFVGDLRSKMLALFYFAIPVGSGLGYIVGSETAKMMHSWKWALRVTPALGVVAVLLLFFVLKDPGRGESEGTANLAPSTYKEDLKEVLTNRSFIFSSGGFTCVAFVAGALSWWAPKFIELGIKLQSSDGVTPMKDESTTFVFGAVTMTAGIVGVSLGCYLSHKVKAWLDVRGDAYICAAGLLLSAPLLVGATYAVTYNMILCYVLLFLGQVMLNLNWAIVVDILLYVVMPNRRSTAEGVQLLVSHALGDAGSPSLVGVLSDMFRNKLNKSKTSTLSFQASKADIDSFKALQYALFLTTFVEILGGLFFLITAFYIVEDRKKVERAVRGNSQQLLTNDTEQALID